MSNLNALNSDKVAVVTGAGIGRAIQPADWKNAMTARAALTLSMYRPVAMAARIRCPGLIQVCMKDSVAPVSAAIKLAKKMGD